MNEGKLGSFTFSGERAATDDHPAVIHALSLASSVTAALQPGTMMKRVEQTVSAAVTETAAVTAGSGNTGASAATVTAAVFKTAVSNKAGTYAFSHDGTNWKLSGSVVTLSDYGLSITGTAASGDTLDVVFTAAVPAAVSIKYAPFLSTDAGTVYPAAVVDKPCDPTGDNAEHSALCVVHGTVKTRMLKTGDGVTPTSAQLGRMGERGIFAV